ncbi:MAG: ABC transporter ATP-binding protein [Bryobacteraceae bacterium]|nr:ABC transporter ATP-binding protein [Bryobacteraceae bacterium]
MIRAENLSRRFGAVQAVESLTLEVRPGEIFALVGPDGAGKTTALRLLAGLLDADGGRAEICGFDVAKQPDAVKDRMGYMAQRFGLYQDLTVDENIEFFGELFGTGPEEREQLAAQLLEMTRMAEFRRRRAGQLSGGMKQKLALICTLLHRPQALLLDEPTCGVDPLSRRDFWRILERLAAEGMAVLVSTAYLDEAERCPRAGLMHRGRLVWSGPPAEIRNRIAPTCFRAAAADRRAARARLLATPGVMAAEPAGDALHVYLEEDARPEAVAEKSGIGLEPLEPSLEDAFIALIRREERRAA